MGLLKLLNAFMAQPYQSKNMCYLLIEDVSYVGPKYPNRLETRTATKGFEVIVLNNGSELTRHAYLCKSKSLLPVNVGM